MAHRFDGFIETYHDRNAASAESRFEESRVRFLLKVFRFNVGRAIHELLDIEQRSGGQSRLTFAAFHERHPTFPLRIETTTLPETRLHLDPKAFLPSLFKCFSAAPFVEPYEDMLQRLGPDPAERVPVLLFPRKGLPQGLVLHGEGLERFAYRGVSMVHTPKSDTGKHAPTLYLRPFSCLLDAIDRRGHGWKPDE